MTIEPPLIPVQNKEIISGNVEDGAQLDISAVGIWSPCERSFFDVRITHPGAPSYRDKSLEKVYEKNENEKKAAYMDRVINVEKGTFVPLVFSTSGGMAPECMKFNKMMAEKISQKTKGGLKM